MVSRQCFDKCGRINIKGNCYSIIINVVMGISAEEVNNNQWSSTENNTNNSWKLNSNGSWNNNNRNNNNGVRGVISVLSSSSQFSFEQLYQAYLDCRKRKRSTEEAIEFEMDENHNLYKLYEELNNRTYEVLPSYVFVVLRPKPREVFAARYRDRIVHHLFYNRIIEYVEQDLIDTTYSCRKGKGTLKAIMDSYQTMMDMVSDGSELYVFKGDIEGFFMNINKKILYELVLPYIKDEFTLYLFNVILWNDPTRGCIFRSSKSKYRLIEPNKTLFNARGNGLPIGNLPSQMFANVYMNVFGRYVINRLHLPISIYVDDFIIFCHDKEYLKQCVRWIDDFLQNKLHLSLHKRKKYLQWYGNGYKFVGGVVKPFRVYISNNIKWRFYFNLDDRDKFISYWGLMNHFRSYNIRKSFIFILNKD